MDTPVAPAADNKPVLTSEQKKLRAFLVISAFVLFSIILVGLFWLSNTTKDQAGWLAFSYATGLSMIVLPCTLPLAFVIVPLAMGKDPKKGLAIAFAFSVGVTLTLSMYGALIAKLGQVVGLDNAKDTMYLIAGVFAVVFGLGELGLVKLRVPTYGGAFPKFIQDRKDVGKGFLLGLLLGNVGLGCPNPAFYVLLSHIATVGSMSTGWFLTFIHAIGRVTPLMLLAILAVLGVDALTVLMKRKDSIARVTAWGVVFVGAFILCFGLLGHDWYVYSGLHSVLEIVTQEAAFVTDYANQFGGIAHAHDLPTGPYLKYGNWLFVTLIAIPMIWNWRKKKKEVDASNPETVRAMKWFGAYTVVMVAFLYLLFSIYLPGWYRYQVYPAMMASHGAMPAAHEHKEGIAANHAHDASGQSLDLEVRMNTIPAAILPNRNVTIELQIYDRSNGQNISAQVERSHGELMHLVGVRKEDLGQFYHIHPQLVGDKFVVTYRFPQTGTYAMWPGIVYKGAHIQQQLPEIVVGTPPSITAAPNYDRVMRLNNDMVVTLKAGQNFYAGTAHHIGFSVTDAGGFDIPLDKYLLENMHINIISPDLKHYHHLHTNYGMIGGDDHGGGGGHMHGNSSPFWALINTAHAQGDGHTDHTHGPVGSEEESIAFSDKDLRIQFAFLDPGDYKIFAEFVTRAQPNVVQRAEFWVNVGGPKPATSKAPLGKVGLTIISLILIAAGMPIIRKYIKEERIKS